jgi:hypothetical protein
VHHENKHEERSKKMGDRKQTEAAARSLWEHIKDNESPPSWWREDEDTEDKLAGDYGPWPPKSFADFLARVRIAEASGGSKVTLRRPSTATLPLEADDVPASAMPKLISRLKDRRDDTPLPPANNARGAFAKGGVYRGKPHAYAAGGRVTDTSAPRKRTRRKK